MLYLNEKMEFWHFFRTSNLPPNTMALFEGKIMGPGELIPLSYFAVGRMTALYHLVQIRIH